MASASIISEPNNKSPSSVVCSPYFEDSAAKYLASPPSTEIPATPLPPIDQYCLNSDAKFGGCAGANGCVAAAMDSVASNRAAAEISLEKIFKLAMKFFKDNEGTTALQISESDRLKLIGIIKPKTPEVQKSHKSLEDNFLDVVGNCNTEREPWMSLDSLPNKDDMLEFIRSLTALCPSFTSYLNAHRGERRQPLTLGHENEEENDAEIFSDLTDVQTQPEDHAQTDEEKLKFQQLKERIREILNKQTIIQFRQYVVQQIPDNKEQQDALIVQLQEQHMEQYMQQVYAQQVVHQRKQYLQLKALTSSTGKPSVVPTAVSSGIASLEESDTTNEVQETSLSTCVNAEQSIVDGVKETSLEDVMKETVYDQFEGQKVVTMADDDLGIGRSDAGGEIDSDNDDVTADPAGFSLNDLPPLMPASLWTRADIKEFKDSIRKNPENVIKVSSLSTATVRVPTHENGSSVFWEFATDSYDLGFGVYFEWNVSPPTHVSIQASESSDEEDLDDEETTAGAEGNARGDVEKGSDRRKDCGPPTDELIQVYRRDCHTEVYCGSHPYPGRGVYLLKFDNSYSLWRSKSVYYRVFYSK